MGYESSNLWTELAIKNITIKKKIYWHNTIIVQDYLRIPNVIFYIFEVEQFSETQFSNSYGSKDFKIYHGLMEHKKSLHTDILALI